MKEVFENIKEKIKNQPIEQFVDTNGNWDLVQTVLDCCCEAVDRVKEEYSNGWIPCSERLPDIGERVFVWVYGRVCIGKRIDAKLFEEYDIFSLENGSNESTKRIDAWQPLPAPYQPKGE